MQNKSVSLLLKRLEYSLKKKKKIQKVYLKLIFLENYAVKHQTMPWQMSKRHSIKPQKLKKLAVIHAKGALTNHRVHILNRTWTYHSPSWQFLSWTYFFTHHKSYYEFLRSWILVFIGSKPEWAQLLDIDPKKHQSVCNESIKLMSLISGAEINELNSVVISSDVTRCFVSLVRKL